MAPDFLPGDRLLVFRPRRLVAGDVVAVRDPRDASNVMIKRVAGVTGDGRVDIRGDNAESSTDSRQFGPVELSAVLGRVVYRYGPPDRVGRIRRS